MIAFSMIFIVAFSTIRLWSHKNNVERFIDFKTKYSTYIIRESFGRIYQMQEYTPAQFSNILGTLKDLDIIERAMVLDKKGDIVAKTEYASLVMPSSSFVQKAFASNKPYIFIKTEKFLYGFIQIPGNLIVATIFSSATIQQALREVMMPIAGIILFVVLANFILAMLLSKTLVNPVSILYKATNVIAGGNLDKHVDMKTGDELQELAENFNYMTTELKKMKARAENANPLTKLPGNVVIHEDVERRIKADEKFVVIYCDLDNFKAFNDKYGVYKGDVAIQLTADIFKEAVSKVGGKGDFVGHEGGDDFLAVTVPERAQKIADYVTKEFDERVRILYDEEDLKKGFIEAKSRHGEQIMKFPIMTISLAGVTNEHRPITNYAQVTNIAAELKKKAKNLSGSNFVLDKRID